MGNSSYTNLGCIITVRKSRISLIGGININKLILIPLTIIVLLSIFSILGLGDISLGSSSVSTGTDVVYYDSSGHSVVNGIGNYTGEYGYVKNGIMGYAVWKNSTSEYYIYYDTSGSSDMRVKYEDFGKGYNGFEGVDITQTLGLIALVVAIMALSAIVGLRIFGSGISEVSASTIILGTSYIAIWGIFSVLALDLLSQIDTLGQFFWFGLTIIYTVGIIMSINGGASD